MEGPGWQATALELTWAGAAHPCSSFPTTPPAQFLNGNPSVPSGLWLNSFNKGMSGGERLVKPEEYRTLLGLKEGEDASNTFVTFAFNWQPDQVGPAAGGIRGQDVGRSIGNPKPLSGTDACFLASSTSQRPAPLLGNPRSPPVAGTSRDDLQVAWYANGVMLLRRRYDEEVSWKDMKGVGFTRSFRPPNAPQHVTFSMWADQDQERAFGGKLAWDKSPFTSQFKDLRYVQGSQWCQGGGGCGNLGAFAS
jgi:hypothetical protein